MTDDNKISQALGIFRKTEEALDAAESNVQKALVQLRDIAGKTFNLESNYFQIRERKGNLYMCELDGPPKGRPKKIEASVPTLDRGDIETTHSGVDSSSLI